MNKFTEHPKTQLSFVTDTFTSNKSDVEFKNNNNFFFL